MNDRSYRFHIPAYLRDRITPMLDQQLWLLGCDVRHPEGNILLQAGFKRQRPPIDCKASTQYHLEFSQGGCIKLWGFGFWYSSDSTSGVFVRRGDFSPRLCVLDQPIWRTEDLPKMHMPGTLEENNRVWLSLALAFNWFAKYEQDVIRRFGLAYRQNALNRWTKKIVIQAGELSDHWHELANQCCSLLIDIRQSF